MILRLYPSGSVPKNIYGSKISIYVNYLYLISSDGTVSEIDFDQTDTEIPLNVTDYLAVSYNTPQLDLELLNLDDIPSGCKILCVLSTSNSISQFKPYIENNDVLIETALYREMVMISTLSEFTDEPDPDNTIKASNLIVTNISINTRFELVAPKDVYDNVKNGKRQLSFKNNKISIFSLLTLTKKSEGGTFDLTITYNSSGYKFQDESNKIILDEVCSYNSIVPLDNEFKIGLTNPSDSDDGVTIGGESSYFYYTLGVNLVPDPNNIYPIDNDLESRDGLINTYIGKLMPTEVKYLYLKNEDGTIFFRDLTNSYSSTGYESMLNQLKEQLTQQLTDLNTIKSTLEAGQVIFVNSEDEVPANPDYADLYVIKLPDGTTRILNT